MSKELKVNEKTGLPANLKNIAGALRATTAAVANDIKPFLKFTKTGDWIYGQDEVEVDKDEQWVINPMAAGVGYVGWGDEEHGTEGQPFGEHFAHPVLGEPMVDGDELPEIDGKWHQAIKLEFKSVEGKAEVVWKANSNGARNCYKSVVEAIADRLEEENAFCCPVVNMTTGSYKHAKYGKILIPVLEIVGWRNMQGQAEA